VPAKYSRVAFSADIQSRVGKLQISAAPTATPASPCSQPEMAIKPPYYFVQNTQPLLKSKHYLGISIKMWLYKEQLSAEHNPRTEYRPGSVARYHGTTAAPRYHFSTVPVPSSSRYFLIPPVPRFYDTVLVCYLQTVTNIR